MPLDPEYPAERLAYMLRDSAPVALITDRPPGDILEQALEECLLIDITRESHLWQDYPSTHLDRDALRLTSANLAYVIYTSGSTGAAKGVMVEHRNIVRLFTSTHQWFSFSNNDTWTLFHSYSFDFSIWELFGALLHGGRLVIVPKDVARSPADFYALVCRQHVTMLSLTPGAFREFLTAQADRASPGTLRKIVFGGDVLDPTSVGTWYAQNRGSHTELINMYGITETTVHVTYYPVGAVDAKRRSVPIGCQIPDLDVYILDRDGQPVPPGIVGEMYVGGAGVARGYLNRPALTAEKFVPDPFRPISGRKLYKTGDLARWLRDGHIEYIGRNDSQVKLRGFRIEPGEIERKLAEHPGISETVVSLIDEEGQDPRLVAYFTKRTHSDCDTTPTILRDYLSAYLPAYMLPSAYVSLKRFPLTVNGKIDKKNLPAASEHDYAHRQYDPPCGDIETVLASMWKDLLRVERVSRYDNFFELGGHSLMVIRLLSRMREAGLQAAVTSLFTSSSLAAFAATVTVTDVIEV